MFHQVSNEKKGDLFFIFIFFFLLLIMGSGWGRRWVGWLVDGRFFMVVGAMIMFWSALFSASLLNTSTGGIFTLER
jgi:hypothetical protein